MEENKKEYPVLGTVTISTEEYRDLITEKYEALKDKQEESERWYREYSRANEAERQFNELKKKIEQYEEIVKQFAIGNKPTEVTGDKIIISCTTGE